MMNVVILWKQWGVLDASLSKHSNISLTLRQLGRLFKNFFSICSMLSFMQKQLPRVILQKSGFSNPHKNLQGNTCVEGSLLIKLKTSSLQLYQKIGYRKDVSLSISGNF